MVATSKNPSSEKHTENAVLWRELLVLAQSHNSFAAFKRARAELPLEKIRIVFEEVQ